MTQLQQVLEDYNLTLPLDNTTKNTALTEMRPWDSLLF